MEGRFCFFWHQFINSRKCELLWSAYAGQRYLFASSFTHPIEGKLTIQVVTYMTQAQVVFDVDIKQSAILRRYMDLPKLLDLLHFQSLYIRRADGFSDRLEGALFPSLRSSINKVHAEGAVPYDADYFHRRARIGNYVSCWTMSGQDSMALWQLYGGVRNSVAVTTTVDRLVSTAFAWERSVRLHRVKYVDHSKVKNYIINSYEDVLQFKHKAYKHEKELRILVPQQSDNWESNPISLRLQVPNLDSFVRSIVVAPEADNEFFEVIRGLCAKYGLRAPVRRSKLAFVPV